MTLYHYCCSHSAQAITRRGFLRPFGRHLFGVDLVWLTDQAVPNREGLGLTSKILPCDRLEFQYIADVDPLHVQRWLDSKIRADIARYPNYMAFEEGRQPETWWIALKQVYVVRNRRYQKPQEAA